MHVLTFQTKFTFGDQVSFDSPTQMCIGRGTVIAITLDNEGTIDYIIAIGDGINRRLQPGILEKELTLQK